MAASACKLWRSREMVAVARVRPPFLYATAQSRASKGRPTTRTTHNHRIFGCRIGLSGCECSSWGSIARQVIVQPHFLHFTTQADGSFECAPIMPSIIGEEKEKVISRAALFIGGQVW